MASRKNFWWLKPTPEGLSIYVVAALFLLLSLVTFVTYRTGNEVVYYVRVIDTHDIVGRKVVVFNGENISFYQYGDTFESESPTTLCLISKFSGTFPTCFYVAEFQPFDAETQHLKFVAAWKK